MFLLGALVTLYGDWINKVTIASMCAFVELFKACRLLSIIHWL